MFKILILIFLSGQLIFAVADAGPSDGGGCGPACVNSGSSHSCVDGGDVSTWQCYVSTTKVLKDGVSSNGCADSAPNYLDCTCGVADTTGPCNGCGYQSIRQAGSCYSNTACSTLCTPVDELVIPSWKYFIPVLVILGLFLTLMHFYGPKLKWRP